MSSRRRDYCTRIARANAFTSWLNQLCRVSFQSLVSRAVPTLPRMLTERVNSFGYD